MKNRFVAWVGVGLMSLAVPGALSAGLFNGSFESADLLGWALHADVGAAAAAPTTRLAGAARPVNSWPVPVGFAASQMPVADDRFLLINTRANGNFLGNDSYDIIVSQNFSLAPGQLLTGWSFFFSNDNEPLDSAWVRVLDQDQNLMATLWGETSGGPTTTAPQVTSAAPWTSWSWSTPVAGNFTLQLGMTTSGANNDASFGFFDGIGIAVQPVPEPTALTLGVLGGLMLVATRPRRR